MTSLEGALREWLTLPDYLRAAAELTPEHPIQMNDEGPAHVFRGEEIGQLTSLLSARTALPGCIQDFTPTPLTGGGRAREAGPGWRVWRGEEPTGNGLRLLWRFRLLAPGETSEGRATHAALTGLPSAAYDVSL